MTSGETLLVFDACTEQSGLDGWVEHFDASGASATVHRLGDTPVIAAEGLHEQLPALGGLPRPTETTVARGDFRLGRRELRPSGTVVSIGSATIGDGSIAVFAGPCAVETREQLLATATEAAKGGAVGLRGGAFKPRTSPHSFQGLKWAGLDLLVEARDVVGLPILTEVVDPRHV